MRPFSALGLILIVLGILALSVHSITYFTTEQVVGPLGFFAFDIERPHTIVINPIAGIAALVVGVVLLAMARGPTTT
jgi:membrane-bound ClpP family serine protease